VSTALATDWRSRYEEYVDGLRAQLATLPPDQPLRLAKSTSNLFRPRAASGTTRLDVTDFDGVLSVDPAARTAESWA